MNSQDRALPQIEQYFALTQIIICPPANPTLTVLVPRPQHTINTRPFGLHSLFPPPSSKSNSHHGGRGTFHPPLVMMNQLRW